MSELIFSYLGPLVCDPVLSAKDAEHFDLLSCDSVLSARGVTAFRRKKIQSFGLRDRNVVFVQNIVFCVPYTLAKQKAII